MEEFSTLYQTSCDRVCEAHSIPMIFFDEAHLAEVMFRNVDESWWHENGIAALFMFTCRTYKFGPSGWGMERSYSSLQRYLYL